MGFGKLLGIGAIALAGVGIGLGITNPTPDQYQAYATAELTTYLKDSFCEGLPTLFGQGLQDECVELVDERRSELSDIIAENTQRQNFLLFSHYHTELNPEELLPRDIRSFVPAGLLPTYDVKTIGAAQQFWLYQARQQER